MRSYSNVVTTYVYFSFQMSKLVANEVLNRSNLSQRVHVIEKWIAVADILKCLNNFNGVLTIISAMNNSSVFRLKKTWDKVSKTVGVLVGRCLQIPI